MQQLSDFAGVGKSHLTRIQHHSDGQVDPSDDPETKRSKAETNSFRAASGYLDIA